MTPLYDAHNHLQDERLGGRVDEFGVKGCVVNGTSERDWPLVAELAKRHHWILPAFGLHPWFLKDRTAAWFDTLRRLLDENPRASIGEIGLDRWMRDPDVADQEEVFQKQLQLAAERNIPATIHCLQAWGALENALQKTTPPARGFLIHSYGGAAEMIPGFAKSGACFSISGYFFHPRKAAQREAFKKVPINRLLIETDAPDMVPPWSDAPNDPRNIARIYDETAGLLGVEPPALAAQVESAFRQLFG